jgi:hypothetical protein
MVLNDALHPRKESTRKKGRLGRYCGDFPLIILNTGSGQLALSCFLKEVQSFICAKVAPTSSPVIVIHFYNFTSYNMP